MAATGANPFRLMADKALASGQYGKLTKESIEWYKKMSRYHKRSMTLDKVKGSLEKSSTKRTHRGGNLIMFEYDAKYKDELPYWDRVPLVFFFNEDAEHVWGLNFHLAPPRIRAFLMDQLVPYVNNDRMDESTKMRLTWRKLQRIATFKFFAPIIRCYLKSHVQSKYIHVPVSDWATALFLPTAQIQKKSAAEVYRDYMNKTKKPKNYRRK